MIMRNILAMAGVPCQETRKTYWIKNQDGTVSIWMRKVLGKCGKDSVTVMVEDVRKSVRELGEKASKKGTLSCNSFLGFNNKKLEAVGIVTLECDDALEDKLDKMKVIKVD